MKHILILLFSIITLSAFGQAGSLSQSVYRSRLNDSTTVNGSTGSGYSYLYWNNDPSSGLTTANKWKIWDGTAEVPLATMFSTGGNFWKDAGTTNVTNPIIDGGTGNVVIQGGTAGENFIGIDGTNDQVILQANGTTIVTVGNELFDVVNGGTGGSIHFQSQGGGGADLNMTTDVVISAFDDINLTAGTTTTGRDINLTSSNGHTHITTGTAGTLWTTTGPFNINTDPGTPGYYLQSNGAGAAPTWVAPSGGGGGATSLRLIANRQTASYSIVLADTFKIVEMNVGSANNLTIPLNATQAFPIGTTITITQYGAGLTSVVATGGVTIRSSSGTLVSPGQYSPMVITKIATDEWYLWNGSVPLSITSGIYTPTLTNTTNLAASTAYQFQYIRVGNVVTFSGRVDVDPTSTGNTVLGITLPITSGFSSATQAAGSASSSTIAGMSAAILSDATNDRLTLQYIAVDVTNQPLYISGTYEIIIE